MNCSIWFRGVPAVGLLLCLSAISAAAVGREIDQANLLSNPGFEQPVVGEPAGWNEGGPKHCCARVADEHHGGRYSLYIHSDQEAGPLWETGYIRFSADHGLRIAAWLKMNQVVAGPNLWNKALIDVVFYDSRKKKIGKVDLVRDEGTHPWTRYQRILAPPPKTAYFKMRFLFSKASGQAWMDDVEVTYLPRYVGWRPGEGPGPTSLDLVVDSGSDLGHLGDIDGIFYNSTKNDLNDLAPLRPGVVRLPPTITNYHLVRHNRQDKLVFDWRHLDAAVAKVVRVNAVPLINLAWVPEALERDIREGNYRGWQRLITEMLERYGKKYDISGWYWQFWNEPSAFREFGGRHRWVNWYGDEQAFYEFFAATLEAVEGANQPTRFGAAGFATASPWLERFVRWCGEQGKRLDFVSWHVYGDVPTEIKAKIERVRHLMDQYPALRETEIVIDEWNSYASGGEKSKSVYGSGIYGAAYRIAGIVQMLDAGVGTNLWFNSHEKGYGMIVNGVKQPTYGGFLLTSKMEGTRVAVAGTEGDPYISALAVRGDDGVLRLIVSYFQHMVDHTHAPVKRLRVVFQGPERAGRGYQLYRLDGESAGGEPLSSTHALDGSGVLSLSISPQSLVLVEMTP